ncbi:transcription antitermination factor NusB [Pseudomonas sp. CBSPBW29]|uniref:transcription antitermination factor NusB n=1 Tax=Pseudomonas TaxID=286 RepID=UPI0021ACE701|nr:MULTISPECIES: transcription antitermination factor NusB [unclassified Pseudomonas]WEL41211.1 transcription antitermination factor NusB [Pseudomonas sp. CBSPBW29]WEL71463.1 transcription antitermination factor NusB [Pseudomonas sp. CBSPCGW29]WEL78377.1 transcription antitermination factor NusB [Pseudomonas sp. CBSPAW29]WEL82987.1 transcription antitermination factor NusB [Pseudomonas sp. CBSPCAW29]WEL85864.1 transcription antitermination factor NusB [Pseudomonas sp. CBSPCBW29]
MISDDSDQFNPQDPRPTDAGKPSKSEKRRSARQLATQALYQRHMAGTSLNEIEAQFRVDNDFTFADQSYFHDILHGVPANLDEIDAALSPCLDLTLEELDPVELAVLRLSTWELLKRVDVPYRVVINEGIELAKVYGSTDGHKFVNGVLDKLAPRLREAEVKAYKR